MDKLNTSGMRDSLDDLVINKKYADRNYLKSSGGSGTAGQIRIRTEPANSSEYSLIEKFIDTSNLLYNIFHFCDWTGCRFSIWWPVCIAICISIGPNNFESLFIVRFTKFISHFN